MGVEAGCRPEDPALGQQIDHCGAELRLDV
jgi:hypothetical protein